MAASFAASDLILLLALLMLLWHIQHEPHEAFIHFSPSVQDPESPDRNGGTTLLGGGPERRLECVHQGGASTHGTSGSLV